MPVCIAGMHRSGTSLMARLLNIGGLYLGPEQEMLPAGPTNPAGHWEHAGLMQINEELLAELGGGWDYPPRYAGLDDTKRTERLVTRAQLLLAGFNGREPWGWKDPRNSLTLPFWRQLVGSMQVVVCVRHPLEVALSLRMRNGSTIAFGLALWTSYTRRLLQTTEAHNRIVTHYQRYHSDPVAELDRVGAWLDLPAEKSRSLETEAAVRRDLRHSRFSFEDLRNVGVATSVCALYQKLCIEAEALDEAGNEDLTRHVDDSEVGDMPGRFDYSAMEMLQQRTPRASDAGSAVD
jgi:hypothetical protein